MKHLTTPSWTKQPPSSCVSLKVQAGLRAEHTHSIGNSITMNQRIERNYLNLFPTLFLSRKLDTNNVLNLSYSRRIDRPNYQNLNPFRFYLDPYTYQEGNPYLRPQFTNSFQLTHVYKSKFSTTLAPSYPWDARANGPLNCTSHNMAR